MNKKIISCIICVLLMIGCKRVSVDFTYSPASPKAGETIVFTNLSSAGEKWAWSFGDNSTSLTKNPNKIYKKPGTYLVKLMVDSASYNTCTRSITIYDTIPTFVSSTDSICHYQNVVFTANVYNPYNYKISYQWTLPDGCLLVSGSLNDHSIMVYFTTPNTQKAVDLTIQQGDKQYPTISRIFIIHETKPPAIVMQSNTSVLRQRIIGERLDSVRSSHLEEDVLLINNTSDTSLVFNGVTFYASTMNEIFPTQQVQRMTMDVIAQKWYITTPDGLFVANFNGQNVVLIDAEATGALYVDAYRNLLYWATSDGLKAMALVKSKNNQFSTTPILYNSISDIDRIVVNNNYR